eukprot:11502267-Heterocapsa_arctica.AAC.1
MGLLLQRALVNNWRVITADVSTAFLHARLDDDDVTYVIPPATDKKPGKVWRVWQALYGLRRAPQYFQEHFASQLRGLGYQRSVADPQLYWHPEDGTIIVAHVDDLLITASDESLKKMKTNMSK